MPTSRYRSTGQEAARELPRHRQPPRLRSWVRVILGGLLAADSLVVRRAGLRQAHRHPGLTEEKEIAFTEQGLVSTSPARRVEMLWAAVLRFTQDEQSLRIYAEGTPVPITRPKRAFEPDEPAAFLRCHKQAPKNPPPFLNPPVRPVLRSGGNDGLPDGV